MKEISGKIYKKVKRIYLRRELHPDTTSVEFIVCINWTLENNNIVISLRYLHTLFFSNCVHVKFVHNAQTTKRTRFI